jgi:hypothetical protein
MKKKYISYLLNPLVISVFISLGVWLILPDYFSKYKVDLISEQSVRDENTRVYFEDINNDGKPEILSAHKNYAGLACFEVRRLNSEVIDQWNFDSHYPRDIGNLHFFDLNENGFKEVYAITINQDSIFMNVLELFNEQNFKRRKIFIDRIASYNNNYSIHIIADLKKSKQNKNEIYFNLNSGFSGYPRNLYKYNLLTNTIRKSPHLTNTFGIKETILINEKEHVFQFSIAPHNILDTLYTKRTDYSSWLTILNNDLEFVFKPIEFPYPYKTLHSSPYLLDDKNVILTLANSTNDEKVKDKLEVYSYQGELLKQLYFAKGIYFLVKDNNSNKLFLLNKENGKVRSYSKNLMLENEFILYPMEKHFQLDIDSNKAFEWVVKRPNNEVAYNIYDMHFKHPVSINLNINSSDYINLDIIKNSRATNFFIQKNNSVYLYNYFKNEWYFLKYAGFIIIYLFVFSLFWLVLKGYKIREAKKLAIEKEISELQLKTVNNQLNPHFVFNAINSISEMMLTDNKLEADSFICKFSDLMRETLQKSDKISTTLQEELDYVENFIQLQQIRFQYQFSYTISIGENIDTSVNVPKHVIYSYVENAIKHGLATKKNGLLKISITKNNRIKIVIEDNGNGLGKSDTDSRNSTGKGLNIMANLFKLYNQLYNKKIESKVINKVARNGNVEGVKVEIVL